ncbi:hypothetical protein DY000_02020418 [Brassica cretica]|uniref:Uncharacterized protein n=1 Tax=Brassica cretica TaxID=69181 RepID=A0ABQ7EGE1_BRACR|nr:hypothetical protein DY000_02020418 [Brassica cretica]
MTNDNNTAIDTTNVIQIPLNVAATDATVTTVGNITVSTAAATTTTTLSVGNVVDEITRCSLFGSFELEKKTRSSRLNVKLVERRLQFNSSSKMTLASVACHFYSSRVNDKNYDWLDPHLGYVGIPSPGPAIIIKPLFTLFKIAPPSSNPTRRLLLIPQSKSVYLSHSTDFGINKPSPKLKRRYMPSSTRSKKETELLFSPNPASLERSIRKEARSSSIDNTTCSSIDFCQPPSILTLVPSTDTRSPPSPEDTHLPSTDIFHPISIDTSIRISIDTSVGTSIDNELRGMVATLILVRDDR